MPKIPPQQKMKNKLYVGVVQDEDGRIVKLFNNSNYEHLWLQTSTESKSVRGFWSILDISGRFIDGNYRQVAIK